MTSLHTTTKPDRVRGLAVSGLVLTSFIWGSLIPLIGALRGTYDPLFILLVRYLPAQPVLLAAAILIDRRWPYSPAFPWTRIGLLSTVGLLGFSALHTIGILLSDPITAAVVTSFGPLTGAITARLLERAAFPPGLGVAVASAIVGGALVATNGEATIHFQGGEILFIASQVCWTWYSMKAQTWLVPHGLSQLQITAATSCAASLALILIYSIALLIGVTTFPAVSFEPAHLITLLWLGVAGTGIGLVTWNASVSRLGVPVATLYLNLIPVFAIAIAAGYGSPVGFWQVIGGLIVIGGVFQMQFRRV
jgi:drug/metabolite transporter (DMT)-like permease